MTKQLFAQQDPSRFVVWLDDPRCQDVDLTGGKAANLGRLAARYPIPPGFCVTTAAHKLWLLQDADTVATLGAPVRQAVDAAYSLLTMRAQANTLRVAVRSSAVGEDSRNLSFAGQYATYLNVVGRDAVAESIVRCWRTTDSACVMTYRQAQKMATTTVPIAVFVQTLVPADASFVAFSTNPITGDSREVVINANWGLGESVVSGTVTPDTYSVDKRTWTLANRILANKHHMIIAGTDGVREVKIPHTMRQRPALTEAQVEEIAHLAAALEQEMGWPVDIEGAYQGKTLWLLQCRPISTL